MNLGSRNWGAAAAAGLLGAFVLVLMSRSVIGHAVHYDELLHVLSARGLLQTGQLAIADGFYTRAELYTHMVAWSIRNFGDSLVSARLPALAAGAILAILVGIWVTRKAGLLAGVSGALLLCLVPTTVDVAVFSRFYTVHAVCMALIFAAVYEAMEPGRALAARVALFAAALGIVPLALHFQDTTIIAIGAAVVAMLALLLLDHWTYVKDHVLRRPVVVVCALGLIAIAGLAAVWYAGLLDQLGSTALWAAGNARRFQFYAVGFRNDLPLLWPLLLVASAIALMRPDQRRLAVFCTVAIVAALVVHSVAAQKSMRYVYYLVPLMCVLWAIALSGVMTYAADRQARSSGEPQGRAPVLVGVTSWALLAAAFLLSQEGARALNLVAGRDSSPFGRPFASEPDWTPLVPVLEPHAREADFVVTSNSMKAIYYLGRYDFELNATIVPETESRSEFGRDRRTGRQAIGTTESIRQVLGRPGKTLVVIEASKIGRSSGVSTEAFSVIESHCEELSLPEGSGVRAWSCVAEP
jgi:hypothetical protein